MLLVIDNYDSFTYNLVQYLGELGQDVRVVRNDAIAVDEIAALAPDAHRDLAGAVHAQRGRHLAWTSSRLFAGKIPILGVCLGHQAIGQAFGGKIVRAARVMHGKTSHDLPRRARACSPGCRTRSRRRATTRW